MEFSVVLVEIAIFLLIFFITKKINFFDDNKIKFKHKNLVNKENTKFTGGIFIFISIVIFFPENLNNLVLYSFLILSIGLLSDFNILSQPLPRFIIQLILLLSFIAVTNTTVAGINIDIIDNFLKNKIFTIFFSLFCFMVLVNGTNFLDGLNTLVAGYYFLVSIIIYFLGENLNLVMYSEIFLFLSIVLFIFLVFNFFGKSILGDSGSYTLSFLFGFLLIDFFNSNRSVSPYFVALILWYPAFENLFSILRRIFISRKKISSPDTFHLHQLIYLFLSKYFYKKSKYNNTKTGLIILFYNLSVFVFATKFKLYYDTKILAYLILFNVIVYLSLYYKLSRLIFKKK
tara:strand:+ start:140 stop:1171 length:1032 start_codon:yes stop_codon:yes gene_type:complete